MTKKSCPGIRQITGSVGRIAAGLNMKKFIRNLLLMFIATIIIAILVSQSDRARTAVSKPPPQEESF